MRNPKYTAFGKLVKIAGVNQGETMGHWARRVGISPTVLSMIIREGKKGKKRGTPRIETVMKILDGFDSKEMREEALRAYLDEVKAKATKR